ncbi:hypothetical protein [Tateyamaria sp.]|uniref:hypothetical protein n=1 Tax=Tateyamaria sp. TaxID=1929288 RepID=UPI00329C9F45
MAKKLIPPDPARFDLTSFADLLPARDPILGEGLGAFAVFHAGLKHSLAPMTPYECVVAENLIDIEWELFQHRRMRDAEIRKDIRITIQKALVAREERAYEARIYEAWEVHVAAGGTEDDWEEWTEWDDLTSGDKERAEAAGLELAKNAVSDDPDVSAPAITEIEGMGLTAVELMGAANRSQNWHAAKHEKKIQELEGRRREVKRDLDALQKARPIDGEIVEE